MKEALWLRSLLSEVFEPIKPPTTLFSDNQAAIAVTGVDTDSIPDSYSCPLANQGTVTAALRLIQR